MKAVATIFRRSVWIGLTLLAAFLLAIVAQAAEGADQSRAPIPPRPRPAYSPRRQTQTPATSPTTTPRPTTSRPSAARSSAAPRSSAQRAPVGSPTPYGPLPPPAPPFRDTIYGAHATAGVPGSPGYLHPHYPRYQTQYGIWFQPSSFHEPYSNPYRPNPFRPRGWGSLFVDACQRVRMDYAREVVEGLPTQYGPAYYPNYSQPSECIFRPSRCNGKYCLGKIWGWCGHKPQRKQRQAERRLERHLER